MKRRQKAGFLSPISSKITLTKERKRKGEKERARRRKGEEKKSNGRTLSFYNSYLGDCFWPEKLFFKNPARCTYLFFNQSVNFLLGAIACLKLKKFEEAVKWCDQGLSVSFYMNLPSRPRTHFSWLYLCVLFTSLETFLHYNCRESLWHPRSFFWWLHYSLYHSEKSSNVNFSQCQLQRNDRQIAFRCCKGAEKVSFQRFIYPYFL